MFEQKRYDFILEAASPIAHASENFGNTSVIMRRRVRQRDGSWQDTPVVSADSMRHGLREAAAYAFLDAAGLLDSQALGEAAIRLLFNGGMVTGKGDASAIKLDAFREMSTLCPPLALLGGCSDNRVIPGRMQVDDAVLICHEQDRFLPEWVTRWLEEQGQQLDTCRAHVEEVQRVRMDPSLDPGKQKLMLPDAQVEVTKRLGSSERAHENDDAIEKAETKSTMMPRRFERVAQGSLFYWSLTCTCMSELDVDTLHTMMACFLSNARVGGKRGTGHGLLRPLVAKDLKIARPAENTSAVDVTALGPRMGSVFRAHVAERREQISAWLKGVNA